MMGSWMRRRIAGLAVGAVLLAGCAAASAAVAPGVTLQPGDQVTVRCVAPGTVRVSTPVAGSRLVKCNGTPSPSPTPTQTQTATPTPTPTDTGTVTPTPTPTGTQGGLSIAVAGNKLVNGAGSTVQLRGVNVSGTEFTCAQNWTSDPYGGQPLGVQSTFDKIAAWKANSVRIPLNEDCWLGLNGAPTQMTVASYRAAVQQEVNVAHAAGLYAVLDLHWSAPDTVLADKQQPMADQDHSLAFWTSLATSYKGDHAVLFDAFNEPYDYWISDGTPTWTCWKLGCNRNQIAYTPHNWHSTGMQNIVDAIRATGAAEPIIVNGGDWANDMDGWLANHPSDPAGQLVAGQHAYPGQPDSMKDSTLLPIAQQFPIVIGETGDHSNTAATYFPTFLPWADSHGISYMAWTWNPWGDESDVLIRDWSGTPTTGEGAAYRNHLLAIG